MIEYILNGAWGKVIPDEKLTKAILDFGIDLKVEARRDGLSNVKIIIDDEKILSSKKRTPRKSKATEEESVIGKAKDTVKPRTKRASAK